MQRSAQLRYADMLRTLAGLDDWLRGLGVPVQQADRMHHAIRMLERAERAFLEPRNGAPPESSKSDYVFGLTEAVELHDVFLAFRNHPPEQLRDRLTRALSGPPRPEEETAKSRDGRNVMFELALGAEWMLCGADVELVEPDLLLKMPDRSYLVACKRPEYEHSIRAAIRSAASQLRSALSSAPNNYFGLIAISLSRVLNQGNAYFSGDYNQLSELLNSLMDEHRLKWRTTEFHARNIAVLFIRQQIGVADCFD